MQDINIGIDSSKLTINVPQGLKDIADDYLNSISVYSRMVLIKYYHDWAANEFPNIKTQLNSANGKKNIAVIAQRRHDYYKKNSTQLVSEFINGRNLLNQNSEFVKTLTDSMMLPVMLVHGNVNHFVNERKPITYTQYKVSNGSVFKNYLNGFIDELNQLLKVDYTVDSNGTMVRRSKIASNTTNEMRIELYRYLKQIYDKWIPSANEDEWNFKNFFDDEGGTGDYKFYFIDSYYNKIGDKLLINPSQLLKTMDVILSYTDINSNLLSLLGTVYGDNRCLFKCIQIFINLADSKAMEDMFKPLSYSTAFSDIRKGSDFVVVYTYEPSKCLDVNSNEYADDGFMLNDEFNTPMSIKTRGAQGKFYRMPAFGVTYGKQYQSFFKRVKVNTKSSIQTEQSIKAKHAILQGLTNKNKNGTQGQDMFDLYTAQSYTCTVEMMGCAWVQPMMYFVLLNVPMFRGSYMIMKVNHSITPGNMTTTFTGCRMSKVGNRFVQDVFINSEGDDTEYIGSDSVTFNNAMANNDNDCPYAVFPVFSDGTSTELKKIVRKWEGEYAGNIDGQICTMRGITLATFRNYYGKDKTCTDLKNISEEQWDNVFKKGFWDKWKADQITNKSIANLLVDWSWGSGCYGFYYPQDVLGTSRSCSAKDADIAAINNYPDKRELFQKLWNRRKQHFEAIARKPGNAQFLKGWLNRLNDFKYFESSTSGNEEELSKMNENVYELFFNAINQTAQNTESMKFGLKNEYYPNKNDSNKIMMVSATDPSNNPKLAKLFDCILNTPDYFRYVNDLYWVYDENVVSNIVRVDVKLSAKDVAANNQHVHFFLKGSKANSAQASKNVFKVEDLSDDLKHSLGKKYKEIGKDKLNTLLGGSISDLDSLADFGPADCATVGTVSGNIGEWSKAVATMGKWYEKNIHEYNQGSTKYCDLIGTNVRKDCSGFVSACLQLFGTFKKGFMTNSSGFNSDASVASMLTNGGFKKLPYSWETVQPYDIIAYSGHVEILAEKGEHPKSWGWGSAHDCQGVHACMPAGTGKKPIGSTYKTIWRHVG
jgi:lysozyme family protein